MSFSKNNLRLAANALTISIGISHSLRTITVRDSFIGWILSGSKSIVSPLEQSGIKTFNAGSVCLLPAGSQWDITNSTAPHGLYSARVITISNELIDAFLAKYPSQGSLPHLLTSWNILIDDNFKELFERTYRALTEEEFSEAVTQHRLEELLLMLSERGVVFPSKQNIQWASRVGRIISQRPHEQWTVDSLAEIFHVSGSTLRKKLAIEGHTVTGCLIEARMEASVVLLQTTKLAVSDIAERCGYQSHSRFSATFKNRFGFTPSELRN